MRLTVLSIVFLCSAALSAHAQSLLDGTTFKASTYNMPDSVGFVRLIDTAGSDCRVEGGPLGDDVPSPDVCFIEDSGIDPVELTFNGGPQAVGQVLVTPTVQPYTAQTEPLEVYNAALDTAVPLTSWMTSGDLVEFTIRTSDDSFPASNEDDYWGFSATDIQYPGAKSDSHIGLPYDEPLGNYTNFYFWYENKDGAITSGYDIFLPVGIGVGPHPTDPSREVIYPLYSEGQADEQTDTPAGGSLDFFSHGSILNEDPAIGNLLFLADGVGVPDALNITGWGLGMLIQPPEIESAGVPGDFNGDSLLTAEDIDALTANIGGSDLAFDVNGDGTVTLADHDYWVTELKGTFLGDADLNGSVQFADFQILSTNFGQAGGWGSGDFSGDGSVQFADFQILSTNFGEPQGGAAVVPEPTTWWLAGMGGLLAAIPLRRRRRR